MNKHILMIMDSLANPNKYTIEQLRDNRDDAYNAYDAATYVIYSAATTDYNAAESAHNNNNVNAAYYAATAATALVYDAADTAYANYWLNSYFKQSGENRQDYIDEINKGYKHE